MSEEYGPNFVTLTDEEGNDIELEYIDALEHNGTTYMAFFPVVEEGEEENEDEYGLIILKSETVDGEEMLANVVDEDEINEVYDLSLIHILSPCALSTTTTSSPCSQVRRTILMARSSRSRSRTLLPPNFCTIRPIAAPFSSQQKMSRQTASSLLTHCMPYPCLLYTSTRCRAAPS